MVSSVYPHVLTVLRCRSRCRYARRIVELRVSLLLSFDILDGLYPFPHGIFFPGASFRSVQELHEDPGFFLEEVESWSFTSMLHLWVGCLITHSGPLILTQDQNEQPRTLQGGATRGSGVLLLLFDACG